MPMHGLWHGHASRLSRRRDRARSIRRTDRGPAFAGACFVVYLLHYQLLPEKRLAALMADLFGVNLVTATIASMSRNCASRFQGFATVVRDHAAAAPAGRTGERVKTNRRGAQTLARLLRAGELTAVWAAALILAGSSCGRPRQPGLR
jgi:hypothetical protein